MTKIQTVTSFGGMCPTQLEATLDDGTVLFGHFRHGVLTWGTGMTIEQAIANSIRRDPKERELTLEALEPPVAVGHDGNGWMTQECMIALLVGQGVIEA